jgi:hypothetical protein
MGLRRIFMNGPITVLIGVAATLLTGCQATQSVSVRQLIAHQALIDFAGLAPMQTFGNLKVAASVPQRWEALRPHENALYTHQQWRSPSRSTGVGVVYIHLPLPMSVKTIVWLAKMQYDKQESRAGKPQGQVLGEWTDSIGREWFEAENEKYHVKGYAVTSGFDAWIVYSGYHLKDPINPAEIGMAARSMDSILPTPLVNLRANSATARAGD